MPRWLSAILKYLLSLLLIAGAIVALRFLTPVELKVFGIQYQHPYSLGYFFLIAERSLLFVLIVYINYRFIDNRGVAPDLRMPFMKYVCSISGLPKLLGILAFFVMILHVEAFRIQGDKCMLEPTVYLKDFVLGNPSAYYFDRPHRGEIVHIKRPLSNGKTYKQICRVIGLPGEDVSVYTDGVYINGVKLIEPYSVTPVKYGFGRTIHIPEFYYYVLFDDRGAYNNPLSPEEVLVHGSWISHRLFMRYLPLKRFGPIPKPKYRQSQVDLPIKND